MFSVDGGGVAGTFATFGTSVVEVVVVLKIFTGTWPWWTSPYSARAPIVNVRCKMVAEEREREKGVQRSREAMTMTGGGGGG